MLRGGWGGCPPYALTVQRAGSGGSSGAKFAPSPAPPPARWSSLGKEKPRGRRKSWTGTRWDGHSAAAPSLKRRGAARGARVGCSDGGRAAGRGRAEPEPGPEPPPGAVPASGASATRAPREAPRLFYSPSDIMSCPAAIGCCRARARRHVLGAGRRGAARLGPAPALRHRLGPGASRQPPPPVPRRGAGAPWPPERPLRPWRGGPGPTRRSAFGDSQRSVAPWSNKEATGEKGSSAGEGGSKVCLHGGIIIPQTFVTN